MKISNLFKLSLLLVVFTGSACSSSDMLTTRADHPELHLIDVVDMRKHLSFLASDELNGRNTLSKDLKVAARYLVSRAEGLGLTPVLKDGSYLQKVPMDLTELVKETSKLTIEMNGESEIYRLNNGFTSSLVHEVELDGGAVFLGYGVSDTSMNWDDIGDLDVKGKFGFILEADLPEEHEVGKKNDFKHQFMRAYFLQAIRQMHGLFVISEKSLYDGSKKINLAGKAAEIGIPDLPLFSIDMEIAEKLTGFSRSEIKEMEKMIEEGKQVPSKDLPGVNIKLELNIDERVESSQNVVAMLEGTDPDLKNEYILYGAHYDHDGVIGGEIYNGADDDGSGTVSLIEIAEAFVSNPPRRSVIFAWHTAEEKGLFGSEYLSANLPVPYDKVSAVINMDMIGRNEDKPLLSIGESRLSTEMKKIGERINNKYIGLDIDYSWGAPDHPENLYTRSDHYNYAKYGIPIAFYTDGIHEDYHKPSDTVDKIAFDYMKKVSELAYLIGKEIANRDEMIKLDVDPEITSRGIHNIKKN